MVTTNIYLSDDDCDDAYFFKLALREICSECKVTICEDGEELLHNLRNCLQLPDIVFLDINMPKITGLEALKAIKADDRLSTVSVVVCSTSKNELHIKKAYELGAAHYIVKPLNFNDYKEQLKNVLMTDLKKAVRNDLENQDLVS